MRPTTAPPRRAARLLVVDWDFFFFNPLLSAIPKRGSNWLLYDWGTNEESDGTRSLAARGVEESIWSIRAQNLLARDLPLPRVEGWESFWDRFTGLTDAPLYYADSNIYSAPHYLTPEHAPAWDRIDLYDAHHDCGYRQEKNELDCGNWMQAHRINGTVDLRVHYPAWRRKVDNAGEAKPVIKVSRSLDDGRAVPLRYDAVFVCRSGSWVPPWCDRDFQRFLEACPAGEPSLLGDDEVMPRPFDEQQAARNSVVERIALRPGGIVQLGEYVKATADGNPPDLSGDPVMAQAVGMSVAATAAQAGGAR